MKKAIVFLSTMVITNSAWGFCMIGNLLSGYPDHECRKPSVPPCYYSGCEEWEINDFKLSIRKYRNCINEYVENAEADIECARQKTSEAIEEYNRFIKSF